MVNTICKILNAQQSDKISSSKPRSHFRWKTKLCIITISNIQQTTRFEQLHLDRERTCAFRHHFVLHSRITEIVTTPTDVDPMSSFKSSSFSSLKEVRAPQWIFFFFFTTRGVPFLHIASRRFQVC